LIPSINNEQFRDQFAFVPLPGKGATSALTLYNGIVLEKLESGLEVDALFIDMSKAFDRATTSHVLAVLSNSNVPIECINWVFSFMTNRYHRVTLNGVSSSFKEAISGVPQGSKCGPILFAFLMSTLKPLSSCSLAIKYADDLTILNWDNSMQQEANHISHWCSSSQMVINSSKTKMLPYHNKTRSLSIAGEQIELVTSFKLLGLIIQRNCKWDLQITSSIRKASKRIFPLIQLRRTGICNTVLWKIYNTHLRSVLTYCFPAYCNLSKSLQKQLHKFERRVQLTIGSAPPTALALFCEQQCVNLLRKVERLPLHPLRPLFRIVQTHHQLRKRKGRIETSVNSERIAAPCCITTRRKDTILRFTMNY
jgi:hypothetical protein